VYNVIVSSSAFTPSNSFGENSVQLEKARKDFEAEIQKSDGIVISHTVNVYNFLNNGSSSYAGQGSHGMIVFTAIIDSGSNS